MDGWGILNACGAATLLVDAQSLRIEYASRAACTMLRAAPERLTGAGMLEIELDLAEQVRWQEICLGVDTSEVVVESKWLRFDGSQVPVRKQLAEIVDGYRRIVVTATDISHDRWLDDERERAAALLAATLESTADAILATDLTGRIRNFNRQFAALWPVRPAVLEASDDDGVLADLAAALVDERAFTELQAELQERPEVHDRRELQLKDGRTVALTSRPQRLRDIPIGRVYCFSDITLQKRAEAALIAARDQAQLASEAKSEYLAAVNHDLKTPVNAILGYVQLLDMEAVPGQQASLDGIRDAAAHLLSLTNHLLDLARIEAGKVELRHQLLPANEVLNETLSLCQPLAAEYQISAGWTVQAADAEVWADHLRLKQILVNLLSNACKYNRPGGRAEVSTMVREGRCCFAVRDTGIGIAPGDLQHIFEPYTRVGVRKDEVEGSGLGLVHSKKLAELMGGALTVSSELGVGSCFEVCLPSAPDEAGRFRTVRSAPGSATGRAADR